MTLQPAEFAVPATEPVWSDGNWWWWNGAEWLLGTDTGWQRLDDLYGQVEPAMASEPSVAEVPPEPIVATMPELAEVPTPNDVARSTISADRGALPDPTAIVPLIAPTVVDSNVLPAIEPSRSGRSKSTAQGGRRNKAFSRRPGRAIPISRGFLVAVIALLLVGVVGGAFLWRSGTGSNSNPTPNPTPGGVAGTIATVGANLADWSVSHPPAPGYPAGTAFVLSPGLPLVNGKAGARYTNVVATNNLITSFRFNLPARSTIGTARFALAHELPTDVTLIDARALGTCEIAHYTSLILSRVLGATNESGSIVVVFRSPTVTYDSAHLAFADVAATSNIPDHC